MLIAHIAVSTSASAATATTPEIVLLDSHGEALVEALRIQLAKVAMLRVLRRSRPGEPAGGSVEKLLARPRVALVLWTERGRLHVAGRGKLRAQIRLPDAGAADYEHYRALAIRVQELFERVGKLNDPDLISSSQPTITSSSQPAVANSARAPGAAVVRPSLANSIRRTAIISVRAPSASSARPESPIVRFGFGLELGGSASASGGGVRPALVVGAGARARFAGFLVELFARALVRMPTDHSNSLGVVKMSELGFGGTARVLWITQSRFQAGAHFGVNGRVIRAEGATPSGRMESAWITVPTIFVGPEVRMTLTRSLALRATAGLDLALVHHRIAISGAEIADLGVVSGRWQLSVVFAP